MKVEKIENFKITLSGDEKNNLLLGLKRMVNLSYCINNLKQDEIDTISNLIKQLS